MSDNRFSYECGTNTESGAITLSALNMRIKGIVNSVGRCWVTGEIAEMQVNSRSGHCYLQLAEKGGDGNIVIASAKAMIWSSRYHFLVSKFEQMTGQSILKGMQVMFLVKPVFHEVYGYSLNIEDVNPSFTLGDIEKKRREIIRRLEEDGVINLNRELEFPLLPKHIAVISSDTAAGLGDFIHHLENNQFGYCFQVEVFSAVMQGELAEESVLSALDRIYARNEEFEVAVIIRGGGATLDLSCFDSYVLASAIANLPVPVVSGIGHERDNTVVDMVANKRVKTPTAAADLLIESFVGCERRCSQALNRLDSCAKNIFSVEKLRLEKLSPRFLNVYSSAISGLQTYLDVVKQHLKSLVAVVSNKEKMENEKSYIRLKNIAARIIENSSGYLEKSSAFVKYSDPKNVLARGFSVTRCQGKILKDTRNLQVGTEIETVLESGIVKSIIKNITHGENHL